MREACGCGAEIHSSWRPRRSCTYSRSPRKRSAMASGSLSPAPRSSEAILLSELASKARSRCLEGLRPRTPERARMWRTAVASCWPCQPCGGSPPRPACRSRRCCRRCWAPGPDRVGALRSPQCSEACSAACRLLAVLCRQEARQVRPLLGLQELR